MGVIKTLINLAGNDETVTLNTGSMEYATAIPVAVTPLPSDPKKTTIKRVAAPTSTVFLPGNKTSRNIIFAGNTLPQGAIPIQINGLNAEGEGSRCWGGGWVIRFEKVCENMRST